MEMDWEIRSVERGSVVRSIIDKKTSLLQAIIFMESITIFTAETHHHAPPHSILLSLSLYSTAAL